MIKKANNTGFTLIEMLVTIGLFAAVTSIIITVLFTAFRASKKSEVIVTVKQSGNVALSRIAQGIRFARSLDDPSVCVPEIQELTSITVTAFDGGQTTYSCPDEELGITTISSNSASLLDTSAVTVDSCSFTCSQATPNHSPAIKIQFSLSAANTTSFADSTSTLPFQTTILLRNFIR